MDDLTQQVERMQNAVADENCHEKQREYLVSEISNLLDWYERWRRAMDGDREQCLMCFGNLERSENKYICRNAQCGQKSWIINGDSQSVTAIVLEAKRQIERMITTEGARPGYPPVVNIPRRDFSLLFEKIENIATLLKGKDICI